MSIIYYHNIECSKSNTALDILVESGTVYTLRNYILQPLNRHELQSLLAKLNMNAEDIIRKTEPVYIEQFEGRQLSNEEWIDILIQYPALLQRPIVEKGNEAIIARPPEKIKQFL